MEFLHNSEAYTRDRLPHHETFSGKKAPLLHFRSDDTSLQDVSRKSDSSPENAYPETWGLFSIVLSLCHIPKALCGINLADYLTPTEAAKSPCTLFHLSMGKSQPGA